MGHMAHPSAPVGSLERVHYLSFLLLHPSMRDADGLRGLIQRSPNRYNRRHPAQAALCQDYAANPPGVADKAASSTSTQWRTGVAVPLCKWVMQPMLALMMTSPPVGAR